MPVTTSVGRRLERPARRPERQRPLPLLDAARPRRSARSTLSSDDEIDVSLVDHRHADHVGAGRASASRRAVLGIQAVEEVVGRADDRADRRARAVLVGGPPSRRSQTARRCRPAARRRARRRSGRTRDRRRARVGREPASRVAPPDELRRRSRGTRGRRRPWSRATSHPLSQTGGTTRASDERAPATPRCRRLARRAIRCAGLDDERRGRRRRPARMSGRGRTRSTSGVPSLEVVRPRAGRRRSGR